MNKIKTIEEPNKQGTPNLSAVESESSQSTPSLSTSDFDSSESHTSSSISSSSTSTPTTHNRTKGIKHHLVHTRNCLHKSPRLLAENMVGLTNQQLLLHHLKQQQPKCQNKLGLLHQAKHISFEEDDLRAKFYKLDRENEQANSSNKMSSVANYADSRLASQSVYLCDSKNKFYVINSNQPNSNNRYIESKYRSSSGQPCIHRLMNHSKSQYSLNSNKIYPGQHNNCLHQQQQQQFRLCAPSLSYKDICSNSKIAGINSNPIEYK